MPEQRKRPGTGQQVTVPTPGELVAYMRTVAKTLTTTADLFLSAHPDAQGAAAATLEEALVAMAVALRRTVGGVDSDWMNAALHEYTFERVKTVISGPDSL